MEEEEPAAEGGCGSLQAVLEPETPVVPADDSDGWGHAGADSGWACPGGSRAPRQDTGTAGVGTVVVVVVVVAAAAVVTDEGKEKGRDR